MDLRTVIISLYKINWLVFITETECVYCAVRSPFYVLSTQCIYVFCMDLRTVIISLYRINWLVFITETERVYCVVLSTFCPHSVFMCFFMDLRTQSVLFPYTVITDWFYHRDEACLVRSTS